MTCRVYDALTGQFGVLRTKSLQGFLDTIHERTPNGEPIVVQHHPNGDWSVAREPGWGHADQAAEITRLERLLGEYEQRWEEMLGTLASISSTLGSGIGDDSVTAEQYLGRIRWGINHHISVTVQRCANVVEELSKDYGKGISWGDIKAAILKLDPASADASSPAKRPVPPPMRIIRDGGWLTKSSTEPTVRDKNGGEV